MNRIILFGVGSGLTDFLAVAPPRLEIVGLMDNDVARHGGVIDGHLVLSPDTLAEKGFDYIVITARAVDAIRDGLIVKGVPADKIVAYYPSYSRRLHNEVNRDIRILNDHLGLALPAIGLATQYLDPGCADDEPTDAPRDFVRDQSFRLAARQIARLGVPGAIAELGVYQGDQARVLNTLFPDRLLYLFDTFSGFSERDLGGEQIGGFSQAALGDFANTSAAMVMAKMPHPGQVKLFEGYFPATAEGVEEHFALVSLDVDLHVPTLAGLEWFYPQLSPGGFIFVHDYNNRRYQGVRDAVDAFVRRHAVACVPIPDFAGSVVITK